MPYSLTNFTTQTGTAYKAAIDADLAALAGTPFQRNVNGDGRVNQIASGVSVSTAWQYFMDYWEVTASSASITGSFGNHGTFPGGLGLGTVSLTTSAAGTLSFRTKIQSADCHDLSFTGGGGITGGYCCIGLLVYNNTGSSVTLTPKLLSADAVDNFATMSHSLSGTAVTIPSSSAVQQVFFDTAGAALPVSSLTNAANGLCLELDFAVPSGLSSTVLEISDVGLYGGLVAPFFGRFPYTAELLRCQRRYFVVNEPASGVGVAGAVGQCISTTVANIDIEFPVNMPAAPTATVTRGTFGVTAAAGGNTANTAMSVLDSTIGGATVQVTVASGLVAGNASRLVGGGGAGKLVFSSAL